MLGALCASRLAFASDSHSEAQAREINLLGDSSFHRGVNLIKIEAGSKEIIGQLTPELEPGSPVWRVAQWNSHFNLNHVQPEKLQDGSIRYWDGAKSITFGSPGSENADLILALNGVKEYEKTPLQNNVPWPHLLVEQQLADNPALTALRNVHLNVSYKLLRAEAHRRPGWDDARHTAQCLIYVTVQNFNKASAGFRDYLWFNVPFYDARYSMPRRSSGRPDTGNHKYMYSPGGEVYTTQKATDGKWITIRQDLLPLIHQALHVAWDAGYLKDSHKPEDYHLGGMNMGWEVTGPWDVAIQIRGLDIKAVTL